MELFLWGLEINGLAMTILEHIFLFVWMDPNKLPQDNMTISKA